MPGAFSKSRDDEDGEEAHLRAEGGAEILRFCCLLYVWIKGNTLDDSQMTGWGQLERDMNVEGTD